MVGFLFNVRVSPPLALDSEGLATYPAVYRRYDFGHITCDRASKEHGDAGELFRLAIARST